MSSTRTGGIIITLALTCVLAPAAAAQSACDGEHYREFDFWIGDWDITNLRLQEDGSWVDVGSATNRVFPVAGGCGIVELWDGYLGDDHIGGFSVRTYNSETQKWHLLLNWPQPNAAAFGTLEGVFKHGRGDFYTNFTSPDGSSRWTCFRWPLCSPGWAPGR